MSRRAAAFALLQKTGKSLMLPVSVLPVAGLLLGIGSAHFTWLPPALSNVMNTLKQLFPRNCRFGNYRIDIKAISGDTGVIFIAPVPICIVEKNWKEF